MNPKEENQRKRGRPQKYLFQKDWDAFLSKEWYPFRYNDWPHFKNDVSWLKRLMIGLWFTFIAGVIAIIVVMIQVLSGG